MYLLHDDNDYTNISKLFNLAYTMLNISYIMIEEGNCTRNADNKEENHGG